MAKGAHLVLHVAENLCRNSERFGRRGCAACISGTSSCPSRPLAHHEQLRTLHSWFFLRLYAMTYDRAFATGIVGPPALADLDTELANMGIVQLNVLSEMADFLCRELSTDEQKVSTISLLPTAVTQDWRKLALFSNRARR